MEECQLRSRFVKNVEEIYFLQVPGRVPRHWSEFDLEKFNLKLNELGLKIADFQEEAMQNRIGATWQGLCYAVIRRKLSITLWS
jgi:hypothetical protein